MAVIERVKDFLPDLKKADTIELNYKWGIKSNEPCGERAYIDITANNLTLRTRNVPIMREPALVRKLLFEEAQSLKKHLGNPAPEIECYYLKGDKEKELYLFRVR